MRRFAWSGNLVNEETLAQQGAVAQRIEQKIYNI